MRTVDEVRRLVQVSADNGLDAASVVGSRKQLGSNRLTPPPKVPTWKKFVEKFDEPIIIILLAAALLSMVVELFKPDPDHHLLPTILGILFLCVGGGVVASAYATGRSNWVPTALFVSALILWPIGLATHHASFDGLAVMVAVILATGVAFVSEYQSDREFEALNSRKESLRVKLHRDGAFHTVALEEVVVGDLVILETGDEVPADGRLVYAKDLSVDQSLMTGESEPVKKKLQADDGAGFDRPGCLYRGTQVVDGHGRMIVTEVGDATSLGEIARKLTDEEEEVPEGEQRVRRKLNIAREQTPLQEKLEKLAGLISNIGYIAAIAIFLSLLVRGIVVGDIRWPSGETWGTILLVDGALLLNYFMYMVIIIVVAVPEGLPMSVTVSLALAMRKMTRANCLVRQLVACETVGSTTVICSDKTGTLTQNKMQVVRLCLVGSTQEWPTASEQWPVIGPQHPPRAVDAIALNAAVNSTAEVEEKEGKRIVVGSSTEGALLQWLEEAKVDYLTARQAFAPLDRVHFSSERKRMVTLIQSGGQLLALVKGAPEWLLPQTTHFLTPDGTSQPWNDDDRKSVDGQLREAAGGSMRTLAFAWKLLPADMTLEKLVELPAPFDSDLTYLGFVAIRDPLRPDVKDAVAQCRAAGIDVKMITGDNVETARAIGREVGLLDSADALVLTSADLATMNDDALKEALPRLRVVARARPLDKYRLVRLLQEMSEVVAVTGDGTNDAPALKKADVGLSMGIAGTEVAKEASKIVLLDDSFATIVRAVHWGRALYENIQRFIQFQLTINVSALVIAFLGPFVGVKPPFTILQLLWINVIMDTFAAIALCSEPPRPELMSLPPKKRRESILTPAMLWNIGITAAFFVVVMLSILIGMEAGWLAGTGPRSEEFKELTVRQVSLFFTIYVMFQVWNEINCRSLVPSVSGLTGLLANPIFLAVIGVIVVGQVLIITFGGDVFKVEPLSVLDWLVITLGTASVVVFAEISRRIRMHQQPAVAR
jgi:Ca2+-transporting ATPase